MRYFCILFLLASSGFAATIRVSSEQPMIQAGINASSDGDTVLVASGTYTGDVNRMISEEGPELTVIDSGFTGNDAGGFI